MHPPLPFADLEEVLSCTREHWSAARGSRIFLTGGTGFFGCWLVESFLHANRALELGAEITVLSRAPAAFLARMPHLAGRPELRMIAGDVRDFPFPPGRFDFMIHAATEASAKLNEEAPEEMLDVILGGARHAMEFARQAGVKQLLLTSSGAVYGPQPPDLLRLPETYLGAPDPMQAASAYGIGKRTIEHVCAIYGRRHGIEVKIARCFAFLGPHLPLDAHFAIGNFLRDAMAGREIQINGDGTPFRSYLYASDLAAWLWSILFAGRAATPYNVGSGEAVTIAAAARIVAEVFGVPFRIAQAAVPGRPAVRYVPDISRIEGQLGVRQTVPFVDAIRRTARWHGAPPLIYSDHDSSC